jgi:hypothetical protein
LVKDGASAIRTLGSSIDTSFAADEGDLLVGGTSDIFEALPIGAAGTVLTSDGDTAEWAAPAAAASGLTLITKSPFTTVSGHSVDNCFTSTYANYKILIKWTAFSADNIDQTFRLRASGSDTNTNYVAQRIFNGTVSTLTTDLNASGTDDWNTGVGDKDKPTATFTEMEIASPQQAVNTAFFLKNWGYTTLGIMHIVAGNQESSTQFDGFTIFTSSGTMSGTVYVYGYQEA